MEELNERALAATRSRRSRDCGQCIFPHFLTSVVDELAIQSVRVAEETAFKILGQPVQALLLNTVISGIKTALDVRVPPVALSAEQNATLRLAVDGAIATLIGGPQAQAAAQALQPAAAAPLVAAPPPLPSPE
jgi:hypothetical protein